MRQFQVFFVYQEYKGLELTMNLATVSANGQITVPIEIRRSLNLKTGDKLLFQRKQNGEVVINNSAVIALERAQAAVADTNYSEEEILADVMNLRYATSE
jgi:AbrB family looped-hinge helix DNA binding protein